MTRIKLFLLVAAVATMLVVWFAGPPRVLSDNSVSAANAGPLPASPKTLNIPLDRALDVVLPEVTRDLEPTEFKTPDGKTGWVIRIPGRRPIATPAYADGKIFVGGGYGSHEFYAFDAETGAVIWQTKTTDDGPSAAVTEDGYVAFNTESCTLFITDARTGAVIWKEWLGDPMMSQPAISKGRVFIAYPGGQRGKPQASSNDAAGQPNSHRLLSADLKTGRHLWEQEISGDAMSAPVVVEDRVYVTSFDGTSYAFDANEGRLIWKKPGVGTSAPTVSGGQMMMPRKLKVADKTYEGLARMDARDGKDQDSELLARSEAPYLDERTSGGSLGGGLGGSLTSETLKTLDASVGFATPPPAAQMQMVTITVGVNTVVGAWAYQGSRPVVRSGKILNAQGKNLNALDAKTGKVLWRAEATGHEAIEGQQVFSPPALGQEQMYLGSGLGFLVSVRQKDGKTGFLYAMKHPIAFQPALARGNVYVGTTDGLLVCLRTGDLDADGWYAWGGNAQHNR